LNSRNQTVTKEQLGVIRTNCKDNLDRTNLVQHNLAQKIVWEQFRYNLAKEHGDESILQGVGEDDKQNIMKLVRIMWADLGDVTSIQYAGTPAMRSDFARTGKSTLSGHFNDATHSVKRYYLNNFEDGEYQDALDILLQKFPLPTSYELDASQRKPKGNIIQRFLGQFFLAIFLFLRPANIDGVKFIYGVFWMVGVYITWTIFRLDTNLIVRRPIVRTNYKATKDRLSMKQ